jgi:hypothetical protein
MHASNGQAARVTGMVLVALLAGCLVTVVIGVAIADLKAEVLASLAATALVSVLALLAGGNFVARRFGGRLASWWQARVGARRFLRHLPALSVLATGFAAGHFLWK